MGHSGGRPSSYSPKLAAAICERISHSDQGLEHICASPGFPPVKNVWRWLSATEADGKTPKYPEFREKYARARDSQAEFIAMQTLAIADDGEADRVTRVREDGTEYQAVDVEHIQRSRLRVDARKWVAAHLAPKKWGDRIDQRLVDENGNDREPLNVVFVGPTQVNVGAGQEFRALPPGKSDAND